MCATWRGLAVQNEGNRVLQGYGGEVYRTVRADDGLQG